MISPQWLELPTPRTNFHDPKDFRATEVRLHWDKGAWANNVDPDQISHLIWIDSVFNIQQFIGTSPSIKIQGPVVQSVVSLTISLKVISLTVLADSIYNIMIFFAEKIWVAFALQKLLTVFSKKLQHICVSLNVNYNESLTNDFVSFELDPGVRKLGEVW